MSSPDRHRRRWLIRSAAAAVLFGGLAACGFEPIAASRGGPGLDGARPQLSNLIVRGENSRFIYFLRRRLIEAVDLGVVGAPRLSADVTITSTGLAITEADAVTRLSFRAETTYRLDQPSGEGAPITTGRAVSVTFSNATATQFTTEINRRDAERRMAEDIADRLINILRLETNAARKAAP